VIGASWILEAGRRKLGFDVLFRDVGVGDKEGGYEAGQKNDNEKGKPDHGVSIFFESAPYLLGIAFFAKYYEIICC
jgi:hypothetical protein